MMSEEVRQRVENEYEELMIKIKKCGSFIYSDKSNALSSKQLKLLKEQLFYMEKYAEILLLRLEEDR